MRAAIADLGEVQRMAQELKRRVDVKYRPPVPVLPKTAWERLDTIPSDDD
jgi:hypothetical protein